MSDQAVDAFASVEQTLAAVEEHLQVFKQDGLESVVAELSPLEKAKVQVSLGTKTRSCWLSGAPQVIDYDADCVLVCFAMCVYVQRTL